MFNRIALAVLIVVAAACDKKPETAAAEPAAAAAAVAKAAAPAAQAAVAAVAAGAQITDEKLAAFIAYKKEMVPHNALALGMATKAFAAGARTGEEMGKELSRDEQLKKFNELHEAALKKAGLTTSEMSSLTLALTPMTTAAMMGKDAEKENAEIDAKKAANEKLPPMADIKYPINKEQIEKYAKAKAEFEAKHGKAALESYLKKEAEFVELTKAEMDAALKAMTAPKK